MAKDYKTLDYEGILFDLTAAWAGEAGVKLTLGAAGPRRKCSPFQEDFETWGKKYKLVFEAEPDIGQKGIRRREMSVILDTQTLLEMLIIDISNYSQNGAPLDHNDEVFARQRKARKDKLHPSDIYVTPNKGRLKLD